MMNKVNGMVGFACAACVAMFAATSASADEMVLNFKDSDLTVTGEFMTYENEGYVLETVIGRMHIPAAMVTCEGNDCAAVLAAMEVDS